MLSIVLLFVLLSLPSQSDALFGWGKTTTPIPVIHPDPGPTSTGNLGSEVIIGSNSNGGKPLGREVVIPSNHHDETPPKRPVVGTLSPRQHETTTHFFTTTFSPTFATREFPSDDRPTHSGCPSRIDAYTPGPSYDLLFDGDIVYSVQNHRIVSSDHLSKVFPSGPPSVKAAFYDEPNEYVVLFYERQVYAYKKSFHPSIFSLKEDFPKTLPDTISFSPNAGLKWHDGHLMLLSNGGMFALYDENWNKSQLSGRTDSYFKGLPDRTRGLTAWISGKTYVMTQNLVYEYDQNRQSVVAEGVSINRFFSC